jgi:hypothetical protein
MAKRKSTARKKSAEPAKTSRGKIKPLAKTNPFVGWGKKRVGAIRQRMKNFLARRPHRSFRLSHRRDYKRSFRIAGYWSFTNSVRNTLWKNKKTFGILAVVYVAIIVVISGFGAQDSYNTLAAALKQSSGDLFEGNFGAVNQAGILLLTTVTAGLSPNLTQAQSVLNGLAFFLIWLTVIWLLRNILAGHQPKVRDALYSSGSPILATVIISFIILVQLLPAAIALIAYDAARVSGLIENGAAAVLALAGIGMIVLASLYWIMSSIIALIIVTLPGMYPMNAVRAAGDIIVGRRLRVLFRLLWLGFIVVMTWIVLVIPIILFDDWLKNLVPAVNWFPLVPLVIFGLSSVTVIFATSYIYLLYRRLVDDDTSPA